MNDLRTGNDRLCSNESSFGGKIINDLDYESSIDRMHRVMDYYSMSQLLQPEHEYFENKKACIIGFNCYKQLEHNNYLLFSKLGGLKGDKLPRDNPYRKSQLAKTNTSRRIKMLIAVVDRFHLNEFSLAFMTLTMPKELSVWLSYQKNGKDMAWRMFAKFWDWYDGNFGSGLAASVNLHTWKSEMPLEPHYHFHCLIPNYKWVLTEKKDDNDDSACEFIKQEWHKQKSGRLVPVSEDDLRQIKLVWWKIVAKICIRNNVSWWGLGNSENAQKLDIHFAFANWWDIGRIKLMHWFNYQGRFPLEDYAKYSNKHTDCPNPPDWLTNYENRTRIFGWWKQMKKMVIIEKDEKIKINPITGNQMLYYGLKPIYNLMEDGNIGFLEVIRGNPVFHRLRGNELAWLLSVQRDLHPAVELDRIYNTQPDEMGGD